jgi:hypothetical protein
VQISNNIIWGVLSGTADNDLGINLAQYPGTARVWNNIIYGWINGSNIYPSGILVSHSGNSNIYGNTLYGNYSGLYNNSGTGLVAKNNISYNNTVDYGGVSFNSASTNNLSKDATAPGLNAKTGKTLTFVSTTSGSEDLHLSPNVANNFDAIGQGADLRYDSNLPITTDIDGQMRRATPDIGADEYTYNIFRSIAPGKTTAVTTGSAGNTLSISGFTATFNGADLPTNVGVGDRLNRVHCGQNRCKTFHYYLCNRWRTEHNISR